MKHIIFILILCCACAEAFSQKDPEKLKLKIDSLKKLGRDSLIKLAERKYGEPNFKAEGYDRIKVRACNDRLVVDFSLSVYITNNCVYSHVSVSLAGQSTTGSGGDGNCNELKYHKNTSKEKKKIQFVFDAINKSDEVGDIKDNKISPGTTMKITEKVSHYHVVVDSWSTHSSYDVDKLTGKISDASHKHYARSHDEKDEDECEVIN